MCGVEVESFAGLPDAVFVHRGPKSALLMTWERIVREWLPGSRHQSAQAPDFEVHGRPIAADTGPDDVEIWISLARQA